MATTTEISPIQKPAGTLTTRTRDFHGIVPRDPLQPPTITLLRESFVTYADGSVKELGDHGVTIVYSPALAAAPISVTVDGVDITVTGKQFHALLSKLFDIQDTTVVTVP